MTEPTEQKVELARRPGAPLGQLAGRTYGGGPVSGPWDRMLEARWLGPYTPNYVPHSIRKLMRRDGQISLGLAALKSPFFGIEYRLDGGSPAVRGFLKRTLLESPVFDKLVWSCLNSLDFGFQSHELVWELAHIVAEAADGGGAVEFPNAYVLKKAKDLDPELVEILVDECDELAGVRAGQVLLPPEKVLHAVNQEEFASLIGQAILDRAYNPWFFCNVQYLLLNRYLEQRGNPPLIGTAPNEFRYDDSKPRDGQTPRHCLEVLNEQMNALRSGGACAIPFEVDDDGNPKWSIRVLEDGGRTETFLGAINHYNAMKLRSLYVPERIATQDTQTGSFAMVSEHVDVFFSMLEVIKRLTVLRPLQAVCEKIVRANFGRATVVPSIKASELSRFKSQLLGDVVKQILSLPRTAPNGKQFLGADFVDLEKALGGANVPAKEMKGFLESLEKRGPLTPPAPKPFQKATPMGDPGAPPSVAELAMALSGGESFARIGELAVAVGELAARPNPPVNVTVEPARVTAPITVKSPDVNVTVEPARVTAPITLLPTIESPTVNVNVEPQGARKDVTISRDSQGRITGAIVSEEK